MFCKHWLLCSTGLRDAIISGGNGEIQYLPDVPYYGTVR